jgi:mRNA deadenylase 3'-5' endonuclease subunit Ccr4
VPKGIRDFNFRSNRIVGEIKNSKSDIVCLQEVDNYDEFYHAKLVELGYESLFKPKTALEYN